MGLLTFVGVAASALGIIRGAMKAAPANWSDLCNIAAIEIQPPWMEEKLSISICRQMLPFTRHLVLQNRLISEAFYSTQTYYGKELQQGTQAIYIWKSHGIYIVSYNVSYNKFHPKSIQLIEILYFTIA